MNRFLEDDVFLVSYPRSGNAWLSFMLANLRFPGRNWDYGSLRKSMILNFSRVVRGEAVVCPRPRVIKTHAPFPIPKYFPRAVYLYRDGRDVLLSYYHLRLHSKKFKGSFDDFLRATVIKWCNHVGNWLFVRHSVPYLAVQYEELYQHPCEVLMKVAEFIGIKIKSKVSVQVAVDKSTREKLSETATKFYSSAEVGFKGRPGGWQQCFTADQHKYFWSQAGYMMDKLEYKR